MFREEKLVLQIPEKCIEVMLNFAMLDPTYISPNVTEGERECKLFFPEDYYNLVVDEENWSETYSNEQFIEGLEAEQESVSVDAFVEYTEEGAYETVSECGLEDDDDDFEELFTTESEEIAIEHEYLEENFM